MPRKKLFWTSETDSAIKKFTETRSTKKKQEIYTQKIHSAFVQLIAVYLSKYSIGIHPQEKQDFSCGALAFLYELLLTYKYPTAIQTKPYTYFFISLRNYKTSSWKNRNQQHVHNHFKIKYFSDLTEHVDQQRKLDLQLSSQMDVESQMTADVQTHEFVKLLRKDISNVKTNAKVKIKVDQAVIEYLSTTPTLQLEWKDLRKAIKKRVPHISRQALYHYAQFLKQTYKEAIKKVT